MSGLIGKIEARTGDRFWQVWPPVMTFEDACFYTRRSDKKLRAAIKKGHLRWTIAKDGVKGIARADLDEFLGLTERLSS